MRQPMHQNPLLRVLAAAGAVLLAVLAVLVGAITLMAFLGLAVMAFIVFQLRLWWIRRRIARTQRQRRRAGQASGSRKRASGSNGRVIEGEYRHHDDK
ncbi:hypothetical protein [Natronospira bacteriovora]|uniref:Uncharacterized protein n=1 Tax=Natronospira bacteriovora TaxID=3069753 RepID=A0ABU0W9I9_9GAMM|nr:hypothetical protein [Natronospira sp. AB-CW4]MDQ2070685.1 hypothetical protein [Natronospira sp. AB-CW4]